MKITKIVVPVDGSESAGNAARYAVELAKKMGATVTLLHVYDSTGLTTLGVASLSKAELDQAMKNISREVFETARKALGSTGADSKETTAIGDPAEEIVAFAKKHACDLIVMGSRGRSPVKQLLLGSVGQKVVSQAHCAVTIVR